MRITLGTVLNTHSSCLNITDIQQHVASMCSSWVGKSNVIVDMPHAVRLGITTDLPPGSVFLMHTIMNCAGRETAQQWLRATNDGSAPPREACVQLCVAALRREWEWVLLQKNPHRRKRCFPAKTSNFSRPEVSYSDAIRRPANQHRRRQPTKPTRVEQEEVQQPKPPRERPVETPPTQQQQQQQQHPGAVPTPDLREELQLLRERLAMMEAKFDSIITLLNAAGYEHQGEPGEDQAAETTVPGSPVAIARARLHPSSFLSPLRPAPVARADAGCAGEAGETQTLSARRGNTGGSPVTPPAKRQSKGVPQP